MIKLIIQGEPVAKGRARSKIVKAKDGKQFVSHYTPSGTVKYEQRVAVEARYAMAGLVPFDCHLALHMVVYVPVPESWSDRKKERAYKGGIKPTTRPDIDNYTKILMDGMNGIVYRDDSLITDMVVAKRYSQKPRVVCIILTEGEDDGEKEQSI